MLTNFATEPSTIRSADNQSGISICLASTCDLSLLREWKNSNRRSFFYQEIIITSQQQSWFSNYQKRSSDYMFIAVLNETLKFGCLGCRYNKGIGWEIYNVINGLAFTQCKGYMSAALNQLISFCECRPQNAISLKVLTNNPAKLWYERNGFVPQAIIGDFVHMVYDGAIQSISG